MAYEPQPLSFALAELIALRGFARVRGDEELQAAWKSVAGEDLAKQARPMQIVKGTLSVSVEGAALLNELVSFQSAELLGRLKQQFPHLNVKRLKFRLSGM
jgi:hypothetical protein